ncbi:hypothetical protein ACRAWD_29110 [Caulobacter segnis]
MKIHYGPLRPGHGRGAAATRAAFAAYFEGPARGRAPALAWATNGTAFQQAVWTALTQIHGRRDHHLFGTGPPRWPAGRDPAPPATPTAPTP